MAKSLSQDEKRWIAESDARTLAEVNQISTDAIRLKAARLAAKKMADRQSKELASLQRVATNTKNKAEKTTGVKKIPKNTTKTTKASNGRKK